MSPRPSLHLQGIDRDWEKRIEAWCGYPWKSAEEMVATKLTVALARFIMPKPPDEELESLPGLDNFGTDTGLDPYRTPALPRRPSRPIAAPTPQERTIHVGLGLIEDFIAGRSIDSYATYAERSVEPYDVDATRRYWICSGVINLLNGRASNATEAEMRLTLAARVIGLGVRIVQRTVAGSPGESEACNGILAQCANPIVRAFSDEPNTLIKISELIADYRYADAVTGRDVDPDLRLAFQAVWEIDEFRAAYALLEP